MPRDADDERRAPTPSTRVGRLRELQQDDRSALDRLLDRARVAHVGFDVDGHPVVLPTAMVRLGDAVAVHGSTGSRWMRAVARGVPACLAVTTLDGIVVARSAFESSLHYHGAVLFGSFAPLEGAAKDAALSALIDHLIPGRGAEVRPSTERELRRTLVLAMPIERWSLKVSDGWPEDGADDVAGDAWAGVVPFMEVVGVARPAPDLRSGIPVPASVRRLPRVAPRGGGQATLSEAVLCIEGMHCESCSALIEETLVEDLGVASAHVDLEGGRATVGFDPEVHSVSDLCDAIAAVGYRAMPSAP